ncbi:protease FtsH-inhibitory lysogeny factor CIII [Serratia marcescens]|nr:protease FtsH-inhibitory lysogeny factor CIII [Serratia marcescens]HAT3742783.1 protease FtsH-inhibitory lysogeny factor CIII [Serratia marcescens]HAT3801061.1 protease FtsH-inhibitory lysogeny factor CIII [Serratia marcescens]HEJ6970387.1 protease FtsH-inhibitory lysogeny factor CIII [Serratia marcescens]HEJ6977277.1 protease FtsH-inhibitory lysogeny factor CIII [Serratia marcescens]
MIFAIAGGARMGASQLHESLLEIIIRRMRCIGRWLKDTLNQRGEP